jgi:hypothetical protein
MTFEPYNIYCQTWFKQPLKANSKVVEDYENNVSSARKRKRHKTGNEEINELCWTWFQDAVQRRINVTGHYNFQYLLWCLIKQSNHPLEALKLSIFKSAEILSAISFKSGPVTFILRCTTSWNQVQHNSLISSFKHFQYGRNGSV